MHKRPLLLCLCTQAERLAHKKLAHKKHTFNQTNFVFLVYAGVYIFGSSRIFFNWFCFLYNFFDLLGLRAKQFDFYQI